MKGFGCHVWEPGIEPAGTREPLSFSAGMSMIGARMCPEHREGLLPSHWSRSSWKAQGSFLSGVTAGSTLTLHMLAPSHPAGRRSRTHKGRGMAGELWSPPARFRSWLHCLTLGDPGRLPPCLSFRSYEVGIIIPASQEATGARSLSHVKDAGGAIVTQ